jgi:hypothetical protein
VNRNRRLGKPTRKRLVSEHFKRDGEAKVPFDYKADADEAAERYNQQAYECAFCGKWHVGNK